MRSIAILLLLFPTVSTAQYRGVSYQLMNETGTHRISSLTFSHRIDNEDGLTFVTDRSGTDTLYQFDRFLNGHVGLSNDGNTIAHLVTERAGMPLEKAVITFYRKGVSYDSGELGKFLKYELDDAIKREALPKSGWLRNDSLLHRMASNAFYITDDRVFVSSDGPLLQAFDMNQMLLLYSGNGANHFHQNYYSVPSLPTRTEFTGPAYFPKEFPKTEKAEDFGDHLAGILETEISIPEEAKFRAEIELKLTTSGSFDLRRAQVFSTVTNEADETKTEQLKKGLDGIKLETKLLPPDHPAWIFRENFWLK